MFDALADPATWGLPLLWQAGLTLAGLGLGVAAGLLLSLIVPVVTIGRVVRTVIGYLPALALVLLTAMLVGRGWPWLSIGLVALAVFAAVWVAALEAGELRGERLRAARALDLPRADVIRLGRGRVRHGIHRITPALWRRSLAVTTIAGLLATVVSEGTAVSDETVSSNGTVSSDEPVSPEASYGLGGLIATALRAGQYPPALAGAVGLILLALAVELALWLLRPRDTQADEAEPSRVEGRIDATTT
ncbi:hypothetical protein [Enemella sp. A6]|uniref:hypothetical protein n=1 Tax=Enemella sp. A6 TaxID=3440152 RepID=UPI003EB6BDB8